MSLILSGSDGLSDIDGSASTPAIRGTDANTGIFFPAADTIAFAEGGAEAMRIDSSGNVGIGTTSQTQRLEVYNAATNSQCYAVVQNNRARNAAVLTKTTNGGFYTGTSIGTDTLCWQVYDETNAERMRIDSSGNLLVGTTSSTNGERLSVLSSASAAEAVRFVHSAANPYGLDLRFTGASPNNTGNWFLQCNDSTALRAQIRANGGLANYSANDANLSDRREKTNFAPAKSYLETICAIPVQTFNYIDQNNEEDPGLTLGVVAQDVQEVAPELVMESNWGTEENPKMRLSIYQTDLQYALMKAIQELKAELDTVKAQNAAFEARLAALEAK